MSTAPDRRPSLRSALGAGRRRWSSALSSLRSRARREGQRIAIAARRAAGCFAFASAIVGAWLLGVWCLGSSFVYGDREPGIGSAVGPSSVSAPGPTATGSPSDAAPEIEHVVGLDGEPLPPRVPRAYPLDGRSRAAGRGPIACPSVELTEHAGELVAFEPPARVTPAFRERLRELERVLHEVSLPFYGRAPSAVLVASAYDCRSISGNSGRLSEHALGNAIDITGFRFDALDVASAPGFELRVDRHWKARGDATRELHARFLEAFTRALIARDVFRTLLGPAERNHADHFHFDVAPHYYVNL